MAQDPYRYFRLEARELHAELVRGALDLEKAAVAGPPVLKLLRVAHTLKGAARVVRLPEIAELAHAIEDALAPLRDRREAAPRGTVEALLRQVDAIDRALTRIDLRPAREEVAAPTLDSLLDAVAVAQVRFGTVRAQREPVERAAHLAGVLLEQLRSPRPDPARLRGTAEAVREALGEAQHGLTAAVATVDREMAQVRDTAERLRLVPARTVFDALERTARDAAAELGRTVAFEARGVEARLDAQVLAQVQQALVQLVRNAVAHGIEPPDVRGADGKARAGRVALEVGRRGTRVSFRVADDGRGLDPDAVRAAAARRGVAVDPALGPADLFRRLLEGGISTSRAVTAVAGRGVGLDVVREVATKLGGELAVTSERGRGTAITLVVPVSTASVEALVAVAGGRTVALPLDAVRRVVRAAAADLSRSPEGDVLASEDGPLRFRALGRIFGDREGQRPEAFTAVVVEAGARRAAIGVDGLVGREAVVVRHLPALAPADPVVAGAALDPEGNPRLVLDPEALVAAAHRTLPRDDLPAPDRRAVLVVDDSLTTRMLEQAILESAGYEVGLASSGEEGLEQARARHYDLFLVDVEMPGMDGFAFVERVRADPALRHVPSVLVTSRGSPEDRARGVAAGARGHVVKSEFDQAVLLRLVRDLVRA